MPMEMEQLLNGDTRQAFDTAHMLKGIIGNCGITPMYEVIVSIVEPLRAGAADLSGPIEDYQRLLARRETARKILASHAQA